MRLVKSWEKSWTRLDVMKNCKKKSIIVTSARKLSIEKRTWKGTHIKEFALRRKKPQQKSALFVQMEAFCDCICAFYHEFLSKKWFKFITYIIVHQIWGHLFLPIFETFFPLSSVMHSFLESSRNYCRFFFRSHSSNVNDLWLTW